MTRVLYWNIENFGINKIEDIQNPIVGGKRKAAAPTQESVDRLDLILDTFSAQEPDIFVVLEVSTGQGNAGSLISESGGASGARALLEEIRYETNNNNWMLIPPLKLGISTVQEGIAVYYNSANLQFTGPWMWPGGTAGPSYNPQFAGALVPGNYIGPWANTLPAGNVTAGGVNMGIPFRRLAGQWEFRTPGRAAAGTQGRPLLFPSGRNRTPFLTSFYDTVNNRAVKVMAYHAPPNASNAAIGTNEISYITEMNAGLGANTVGVIVGDFNVDVFDNRPLFAARELSVRGKAFDQLIANGYDMMLPFVHGAAPPAWPYRGYYGTHMTRVPNAYYPANAAAQYPGGGNIAVGGQQTFRGYMTQSFNGSPTTAIDNILVKYSAGMAPPPHNFTVINHVTGSPYNAAAIPNPPPRGNLAYASALTNNPPGGVAEQQFRGWENFGKIRSTSDHMALIVDV